MKQRKTSASIPTERFIYQVNMKIIPWWIVQYTTCVVITNIIRPAMFGPITHESVLFSMVFNFIVVSALAIFVGWPFEKLIIRRSLRLTEDAMK